MMKYRPEVKPFIDAAIFVLFPIVKEMRFGRRRGSCATAGEEDSILPEQDLQSLLVTESPA